MNQKSILFSILTIFLITPAFVSGDGNIRVTVSRGNLYMVGGRDATGQAFKMIPTGVRNQYQLEGLADTTLNGSATLVVSGVTNDVDIKIYSAESVIILSKGDHDSLEINGRLKITSTSRLQTTVILKSVFCYQTLSLSTGAGKDVIINGDSTFKWKTSIQTGADSDVCYSFGCGTTEMIVDGGTGDDCLMVESNLFSQKTLIKGQSGNDSIAVLSGSPAEEIELDGGAGDDQFAFEGSDLLLTIRRMESEFPGTFVSFYESAVARSEYLEIGLLVFLLA